MKLGVIGCGKMGTALVAGAVRAGVVDSADVTGVDPVAAAREAFAAETGGQVAETTEALADCEVVLLCTKPWDVAAAVGSLADGPRLVISVAAGCKLDALEAAAGVHTRVIRAMPNTPALVGKGAAAFCMGGKATDADAETASLLLGSVGVVVNVPEKLMDAVTGLSGSGPAYGYVIIEALSDGGVKAGLPRAEATRLAAQTMLGAAAMVLETGKHPGELKDMVTSPGGTTIAGVAELERAGVRSALIEAVAAATERAKELGA
ncbi:MAG: pyrroline-5-carboxylate reductase [Verrucomicrobiales bacterium]|nr:pyrroline-5-carboxylate reductase [Verrucomicrobiota bacterium JB025]